MQLVQQFDAVLDLGEVLVPVLQVRQGEPPVVRLHPLHTIDICSALAACCSTLWVGGCEGGGGGGGSRRGGVRLLPSCLLSSWIAFDQGEKTAVLEGLA